MTSLTRHTFARPLCLAALVCFTLTAASCSSPASTEKAEGSSDSSQTAPQAKVAEQAAAAPAAEPANSHPVVIIETTLGTMEAELYEDKAPLSVENFLAYADAKEYDGTVFHRVIKKFMVQGGGFTPEGTKTPTRGPVKNEAHNGLKNTRGTLAMARTGVVDSATNQFFINHADNVFLDHKSPTSKGYGYAVFGALISGDDILEKIAATPTQNRGGAFASAPVETVVIKSIRLKTSN
jgi:cyclophilin family peptidyl-prolyl cis-trans isomerase